MIKIKFLLLGLGCLLAANAFSGKMGSYDDGGRCVVATLSLGPAWARPGETQTLSLGLDVQKTYVPLPLSRSFRWATSAEGTRSLFTGEFFIGFTGNINSVVQGQLGLAIGGSSSAKLHGHVWEDSNFLLNNYNYSYSVSNKRLALKAKALYDIGVYDLYPYLSGSAGVAKNNSSGFIIRPLLSTEVPPPSFSNRSATAFSYTIGVGLEAEVDDGWRVGLGYEFADWGHSSLDAAAGQWFGRGLRLRSLRAHELQISLSYLS